MGAGRWSRWRGKTATAEQLALNQADVAVAPAEVPDPVSAQDLDANPALGVPEADQEVPQLAREVRALQARRQSNTTASTSKDLVFGPGAGFGTLTVVALVSLAGGHVAAVVITACAAAVLYLISPPSEAEPRDHSRRSSGAASSRIQRTQSTPPVLVGRVGSKSPKWPPSAPLRAKSAPLETAASLPSIPKVVEVASPLSPTSPLSPQHSSPENSPLSSPVTLSCKEAVSSTSTRNGGGSLDSPAASGVVGLAFIILGLSLIGRGLAIVSTITVALLWAFGKRVSKPGVLLSEPEPVPSTPQPEVSPESPTRARRTWDGSMVPEEPAEIILPAHLDQGALSLNADEVRRELTLVKESVPRSENVVSKRRKSFFGRIRGRLSRQSSCAPQELATGLSSSTSIGRRRSF